MFHFKALFLAMALLEQDSLCSFGLTKTFRFGGGWLQTLFLMVGGVAPDGFRELAGWGMGEPTHVATMK